MLLRVLCLRNGNQQAATASAAVALAVRELKLPDVEVVESNSADFHPLNAVIGCDRLAIVDDAAKATPHYRMIADAFEAASDMNLGVPCEIVILALESTLTVANIVGRIRDFAARESGNRRDTSMCHTDLCDVCVGENSCTDRFVVKPDLPS